MMRGCRVISFKVLETWAMASKCTTYIYMREILP